MRCDLHRCIEQWFLLGLALCLPGAALELRVGWGGCGGGVGWAAGRNLQLRSYVASFTPRVCRPGQRVCSGADLLLPSLLATRCFLHRCITWRCPVLHGAV